MAVFKCKMCGGTLEFKEGDTVAVCDSCGTKQTLPRLDDDKRANLYDRANHFRRNNEFDKAMAIYEEILNEDSSDSETYWSIILCRYGIEYVEDPKTHKRVPTINRTQFTSIFDDDNYKSALKYADSAQKAIYEQEATAINEIQKGILSISQKEEPFDIFICYKETDSSGKRTQDSVLANDLYHQLTQDGFKVFFSRITLEDKLGTAYEPYIFAALNSAKVMVVIGTKPEYFNAVWVKNEWSRYLALIKNGAKKVLIPAYRDMDPYDLPEEFSHLQAQDMSKLGFMQDLIRGIKKIISDNTSKNKTNDSSVSSNNSSEATLLKRAFMFLEDGNFDEANDYCEKVLDINPENAQAYLGKLMVCNEFRSINEFDEYSIRMIDDNNYKKVIKFGDEKTKKIVSDCNMRSFEKPYQCTVKIKNEREEIIEKQEDAIKLLGILDQQDQEKYRVAKEASKPEFLYDESYKTLYSDDELRDLCLDYKDSDVLIQEIEKQKKLIDKNNEYLRAIGVFYNPSIIPDDELRLISSSSDDDLHLQAAKIFLSSQKFKLYRGCTCAIDAFSKLNWKDSKEKVAQLQRILYDLRGDSNKIYLELEKQREKERKKDKIRGFFENGGKILAFLLNNPMVLLAIMLLAPFIIVAVAVISSLF